MSEIVEAKPVTAWNLDDRFRRRTEMALLSLSVDASWITGNLEVRGEQPTSQDKFVLGYYQYQEADSRVRRLPFFLDLAQS